MSDPFAALDDPQLVEAPIAPAFDESPKKKRRRKTVEEEDEDYSLSNDEENLSEESDVEGATSSEAASAHSGSERRVFDDKNSQQQPQQKFVRKERGRSWIKTILPEPPALSRKSHKNADGKFPCASCGLILDTTSEHREHIAQHRWGPHERIVDPDTGKAAFKCLVGECPKILADRKVLRKHLMTHRPPKFKCDHPGCSKRFPERAKLDRHRITHTGEKKFECFLCGKRFGYKSNLNSHVASHVKRNEVSPADAESAKARGEIRSRVGAAKTAKRTKMAPKRATTKQQIITATTTQTAQPTTAFLPHQTIDGLFDPNSVGLAASRPRRRVKHSSKVVDNIASGGYMFKVPSDDPNSSTASESSVDNDDASALQPQAIFDDRQPEGQLRQQRFSIGSLDDDMRVSSHHTNNQSDLLQFSNNSDLFAKNQSLNMSNSSEVSLRDASMLRGVNDSLVMNLRSASPIPAFPDHLDVSRGSR